MGKKRRNTAKTGDSALYKSREDETALSNSRKSKDSDDDDMFNEVDRFHNQQDAVKDILRFDDTKDEDSIDDGVENVENVLDLGMSESSDGDDEDSSSSQNEGDDDDDDDDDEEENSIVSEESSDEDENFDLNAKTDVLDWGNRKRDYYHGDTADLEIGQEEEDAELEEEAGEEVLNARLKDMDEDDFMLEGKSDSDSDVEINDAITKSKSQNHDQETISDSTFISHKRKNLSNLTRRQKIKLMKKAHPELLPLVQHFRESAIKPCAKETLVVSDALLADEENAEAVGATTSGLQYLVTKAMLQTSTALNLCQYLLLKAEHAASSTESDGAIDGGILGDCNAITNHPVMARLNQLNMLKDKLDSRVESKVHGLKEQMRSLVEASALVAGGDDNESESSTSDSDSDDAGSIKKDSPALHEKEEDKLSHLAPESDEDSSSSHDEKDVEEVVENDIEEDEEEDEEEDDQAGRRRVMNEARFSLRPQEDIEESTSIAKTKRRRAPPTFSDFGDDDHADEDEVIDAAGRSLASTINSISQRKKSDNNKTDVAPEDYDVDDDKNFERGLDMMDAELGEDDTEKEIGANITNDNVTGDDFYEKVKEMSKAKKMQKQSLYTVAPKYPGMEQEIKGERAVGNMIMKNRGLVAHKAKINRNPRVKKREQYRKALIRRKGAVQEIRTEEAHKYGGEETGVKSKLSRSRKLTK